MSSESLYYEDPYLNRIEAEVAALHPRKKGWAVELEKTIFYPEGGGQPGDRGWIGDYRVETTVKEGKSILHILETEPACSPGDRLPAVLDWDHRYDYMQQHTGQHILSGVFHNLLGIGTRSVHQGLEYTTIDIDREQISEEEIIQVEEQANSIIRAGSAVSWREVTEEDLPDLDLRREPKVSGRIRVVEIDGSDRAACGGVHLAAASEVQLLLCIGVERVKENLRTYWKIGRRALEDYRLKDRSIRSLMNLLSARPDEVVGQAELKVEQAKELQAALTESERSMARLILTQAFSKDDHIVTLDLSDQRPGFLKQLLQEIPQDRRHAVCAVQRAGDQLQWLISISPEITGDFSFIRTELFPVISAKGGGKPPVWQGAGTRPEEAGTFLNTFRELLSR